MALTGRNILQLMQAPNVTTLRYKNKSKKNLNNKQTKVTLAKAAPAKRRGIRVIVLRVSKPAV